MLRDIWERYGDPVIVRKLRLVCRAFADELRPLPLVEQWSGSSGSAKYSTRCRKSGKYAASGEYFNQYWCDGIEVALAVVFPPGIGCMVVDVDGTRYYNTTAEQMQYYDAALSPSARRLYFDLTFIGGWSSIDINTYDTKNLTVVQRDDLMTPRDNLYMITCDDGYGMWYDICTVAYVSTLADIEMWKVTPRLLGP